MRNLFCILLVSVSTLSLVAQDSVAWKPVNLGLSVMWADMNVGAASASQTGTFFAWAEMEGKETYTPNNYQHMISGRTDNYAYTKYTIRDNGYSSSSNCAWYSGSTFVGDDLQTLESEDDAATVAGGEDWRTPTAAEWQELISQCTWRWSNDTTGGKRAGYYVVGPNGNSIFLPAGGARSGATFMEDSYCYYWSSEIGSKTMYAKATKITGDDKSKFAMSNEGRTSGFPVRAVSTLPVPEPAKYRVTFPEMTTSEKTYIYDLTSAEEDDYITWHYDCDSTNNCITSYLVEEGHAIALYAPYPAQHNTYRFDHWVSSDSTINGRTDVLLRFTPTADLTLSFVMVKANAPTVIGGDTITFSDTTSVPVDVKGDGTVVVQINSAGGSSTITLTSADVEQTFSSELVSLIMEVVSNSTVSADGDGIHFEGNSLTLSSEDTAMLIIEAANPIVGNGLSVLTIDARVILRSVSSAASAPARHAMAAASGLMPAISGFSDVVLAPNISVKEVWYGNTKGEPLSCQFYAPAQSFGEVDIETQSFTPATTLVFSDDQFYVDYIDGKIDVSTVVREAVSPATEDLRCFDILGRPIPMPERGIFIQCGKVYLR